MLPYYKEEEEAKLHRQLSQKAVELAVQGRWEEAEMVNQDIIERFAADVEAYNRLGRALIELGDLVRAKEAYAKALELAPDNTIAKKNLSRIKFGISLSQSTAVTESGESRVETKSSSKTILALAPDLFVTEMGKAGVAKLHNICIPSSTSFSDVLERSEGFARLIVGDRVQLRVEGQRLIVESEQGEYVGEVEPKHALRLIKLIKGGNRYDTAILKVGDDDLSVIIKEVYQHPSQAGCLSFPLKQVQGKSVAALRSYAKGRPSSLHPLSGEGREEEEQEEGGPRPPYPLSGEGREGTKEIEHPGEREESDLEGFTVSEISSESIFSGENEGSDEMEN